MAKEEVHGCGEGHAAVCMTEEKKRKVQDYNWKKKNIVNILTWHSYVLDQVYLQNYYLLPLHRTAHQWSIFEETLWCHNQLEVCFSILRFENSLMECLFAIRTVAKGPNNTKYPKYTLVL